MYSVCLNITCEVDISQCLYTHIFRALFVRYCIIFSIELVIHFSKVEIDMNEQNFLS